jgi:molybdopterin-guanine dinucleotide biosynthesis protein A
MSGGRVAAIVLAGGRSERFGRDKRLVLVDGEPLLHRSLRAVSSIAGEIVLVIAPGETDPVLPPDVAAPVRIVHDRLAHTGPLAGLLTGLEAASEAPFAIAVGADMPWLEPAVLRLLLDAVRADGPDAWILDSGDSVVQSLPLAGRAEPLRLAARALLQRGDRSLRGLLLATGAGRIPEATWRALDPDGRTVRDIDRPEDLEAIGRER